MRIKLILIGCLFSLLARAQVAGDPNFVLEFLYFGNGIISVRFDEQGAMYASEKQGRLLRFAPDGAGGFDPPIVLIDVTAQVDAGLERGLLGLTLDPDFAANRRVYLLYSTTTDQRVVSYQLNPGLTGVEPGSEVLLLGGLPNQVEFHKGGDLNFSPDDDNLLLIALGDDGLPGEVSDLSRYEGKMLRIDKVTGEGAAGNPFFDGDFNSVQSRVWATGLRNPFRFTFHPDLPVSDVMYVSENGDGTDRITWVLRGSDGNWNLNGDGFVGCPGGCFLDPSDPDHRILERIEPSQIGIEIATQGPFAVAGVATLYSGNWFPNEFSIRRWTLSGVDQDVTTAVVEPLGGPFYNSLVAIDLTFGPDGCLYLTDAGVGAGDGSIQRICFVAGQPPNAAFTTDVMPPRGVAPLTVQFINGSTDDGTLVSHQWDFGDGQSSNLESPSHQFTDPGEYPVRLTVTDNDGQTDSDTQQITVFSNFSLNLTVDVMDAGTLPPVIAASAVDLSFYRLDAVSPLPVPGGTGVGGNVLSVPGGVPLTAMLDLELVEPGLVFTVAEPPADGFGFARVGLGLDLGLGTAAPGVTVYLAETMITGQVVSTVGVTPVVDVGVSNGAPYAFGGARDHLIVPTGVAHRVDVDNLGYFHVPLLDADGTGTWRLDSPGDTNVDQFGGIEQDVSVIDGQTHEVELLLGLFGGGTDCDDLSGIASTARAYTSVQDLFSSQCTGCHTAVSPNSGGLDLTPGSLGRVANGFATGAPGVGLVTQGDETRSYLFEKINCADPQAGTRMRPTNAMDLDQQAVIRDWIRDHIRYDSFEDF